MVYSHTLSLPDAPSAVALGLFDGIHLGHRTVIERAVSCAPKLRPTVFTFTFDRPEAITKPNFANIMTASRKAEVFRRLGVEAVCEPPFSSFSFFAPEEFFEKILRQVLHAEAIFCGEDFRFGQYAAGDSKLLGKLCREAGIRFYEVPPLLNEGIPISSTHIRELLREGKTMEAAELLGEPYTIDYPVAHGRQIGRTMGYPTTNQIFEPGDLIPRSGVYVTLANVDGTLYPAVTNVGVKPTLGGTDAPSAESTLIGYSGDLYDRKIPVSFYQYLRPERRFDSIELLFEQIARDAETSRRFFEGKI